MVRYRFTASVRYDASLDVLEASLLCARSHDTIAYAVVLNFDVKSVAIQDECLDDEIASDMLLQTLATSTFVREYYQRYNALDASRSPGDVQPFEFIVDR